MLSKPVELPIPDRNTVTMEPKDAGLNAVAEIDTRGQGCRDPIGMIRQAFEKATDASNGDGRRHGHREEVSGATGDSHALFDRFDGHCSAHQSTDNSLTRHEIRHIELMSEAKRRIFEPVENSASERRPDKGANNTVSLEEADKISPSLDRYAERCGIPKRRQGTQK
jgi:hypothetical protein